MELNWPKTQFRNTPGHTPGHKVTEFFNKFCGYTSQSLGISTL